MKLGMMLSRRIGCQVEELGFGGEVCSEERIGLEIVG